MNNIINIGIPSKGRLRKDVLKIFKKKRLTLISERGERDLIGSIKNKKNIKILYLHAREIIERLGDNSLDVGFSGFDLYKESEINNQRKKDASFNLDQADLISSNIVQKITNHFAHHLKEDSISSGESLELIHKIFQIEA